MLSVVPSDLYLPSQPEHDAQNPFSKNAYVTVQLTIGLARRLTG
jgi:hypothetical protein